MSINEGASKDVSRRGETVTSSAKKVPTATIEHVRRAIQNAPECTTKEVPKLQAIRTLIPDIQQLQSKGYDWRAVASLLSEHGIAISVVTLKSYLQRAKAWEVRPHRKGRGGKDAEPRTHRGAGKVPRRGAAKAGEVKTQGRSEDAAEAPGGPPKEAAEGTPKAGRASAPGAAARPWSFVPEEDTDDL
jgi:hypothetical protein